MSGQIAVLFVDDEEDLRRTTTQMLELRGIPARSFASADQVLPLISRDVPCILVTDIRMMGMTGMELMRRSCEIDPELPVILVTGYADVALAVQAMRTGAYDFIEKPFSSEQFLDSVTRALEKRRLTLEIRALRHKVANLKEDLAARLVGQSKLMRDLRRRIRSVAQTRTNLLIVGDPGSGKEIAARAVHELSHDRERPFIVIDCSALTPERIERDLFGYEAGTVPGAPRARIGRFEHARNGTVFLDRIEQLPPAAQAKLGRVIQDNSITRLGSVDPVDLNCRFIASTCTDLEHADRAFRRDLLYQLSVVTLRVPSLAERPEDIPALAVMLVRDAAKRLGLPRPRIAERFLTQISGRNWPGNVRELRNEAERLVLGVDATPPAGAEVPGSLADRLAAFEKQQIEAELVAHRGQLKAAYEALGFSRKTLYQKMQKYGLDKAAFKGRRKSAAALPDRG